MLLLFKLQPTTRKAPALRLNHRSFEVLTKCRPPAEICQYGADRTTCRSVSNSRRSRCVFPAILNQSCCTLGSCKKVNTNESGNCRMGKSRSLVSNKLAPNKLSTASNTRLMERSDSFASALNMSSTEQRTMFPAS